MPSISVGSSDRIIGQMSLPCLMSVKRCSSIPAVLFFFHDLGKVIFKTTLYKKSNQIIVKKTFPGSSQKICSVNFYAPHCYYDGLPGWDRARNSPEIF
jgi:hypothetical protein